MPEEVTVRDDLKVIQVVSHGDITHEDLTATLEAILGFQEDRGFKRVLVDGAGATSYPSTLPVFDFGSEVAVSLAGTKVAIMIKREMRGQAEFFVTVARNRGANVSLFDTREAALSWLREQPNKAIEARWPRLMAGVEPVEEVRSALESEVGSDLLEVGSRLLDENRHAVEWHKAQKVRDISFMSHHLSPAIV